MSHGQQQRDSAPLLAPKMRHVALFLTCMIEEKLWIQITENSAMAIKKLQHPSILKLGIKQCIGEYLMVSYLKNSMS